MSTKRGPPKHQNKFAWKPKAGVKINETEVGGKFRPLYENTGVCPRCKDQIEWKRKYGKYKPLSEPAKCQKCSKRAAEEGASLQSLNIDLVCYVRNNITRQELKTYFLRLRDLLSEIMLVENIPLRVLKGQNKISGTNLDYLVSLPIEYNDIRFHILLKREDLYVVGIEMRGKCYMYCTNEKDEVKHSKLVKKCLETYKGELIEVNVGNSYAALEHLAQLKRADLKVDKQLLLELCNNIVTINLGMVDKILGKTLLMITQLLCEPLRIKSFARHIFSHFDDPRDETHERYICIFPHQKYLALEHFWKHGSVILLRGPSREFVATFFDEMDNKVEYALLYREFGILKRFEGSQLVKEFCELDLSHKASKGKTTVIISKLLHAYFGKSIKELIKPLRSKEADGINCTGNVKIHIYSRYVVLQYNYNCSLKDVTVSVNPSNGFTRSQLEPLTSLWRKSFVAFERNDSTSSTFSTTFSCMDGNGLVKKGCFAEFGVSARDFFRGSGTKSLVDLKNFKSGINLKIDFGMKLTFEEAKTATTEIFDMEDVTRQGVPMEMSSGIALFRSVYMNTHEVLLLIRVQDLHRNDTAKTIDLCVKCEDENLEVIREILDEWVLRKKVISRAA